MTNEKRGQIKVIIERQDRLRAITSLSSAIEMVAKALSNPVTVFISHNIITTDKKSTGIEVITEELETETREY